jgi:hypothetical protein
MQQPSIFSYSVIPAVCGRNLSPFVMPDIRNRASLIFSSSCPLILAPLEKGDLKSIISAEYFAVLLRGSVCGRN